MLIRQIFDPSLSQYAYLIGCPKSGEALLVDPQRDIQRYLEIADEAGLKITRIAETHIHADFLAGTREFLEHCDSITAFLSDMGNEDWKYNWASDHERVELLNDGDKIEFGSVTVKALHTPGHTPEHLSYVIYDGSDDAEIPRCILTGDFIFVGDTGRPDLLDTAAGGDNTREPAARDLFASIQKFKDTDEGVMVLPGHGAGSSCGKSLGSIPWSTFGYEKRASDAITTALRKGEDAFVKEILSGQPEPSMYFSRMKHLNRDGVPLLEQIPQPEKCDALPDVSKSTLLDTRNDRVAFMEHHVKGSLHAPLDSKFSEAAGSYVDPDRDVYLIVSEKEHVSNAVKQLIRIGIDKVVGFFLFDELKNFSGSDFVSIKMIDTTEINPHDTILDVRGADEYEEAHIPGAINVAHTRLVADSDELPEIGPVTVHCGSGVRAALAASQLERVGYEVTYANGFFKDWKKQAEEVATA